MAEPWLLLVMELEAQAQAQEQELTNRLWLEGEAAGWPQWALQPKPGWTAWNG
jgi:hypothetical protein